MNIHISTTALLLGVAKADEIIDENEIKTIQKILIDFFDISMEECVNTIEKAKKELQDSTDLYNFGKKINEEFNYDQKINFILSIYKVAFVDSTLHYLEQHIIKQIANFLHIDNNDLIAAKLEMKNYLD